MLARFLALAVCTVPLLALLGLWGFVETETIDRLAYGIPVALPVPTSINEGIALLEESTRGKGSFVPILAVAFAILLILDARALFVRDPARGGQVRQPADDPMGYARLRLRRYLLIPLVAAWAFVFCHGTGTPPRMPVLAAMVVAFVLARRGENETYATMFNHAMDAFSDFCKGLSRGQ